MTLRDKNIKQILTDFIHQAQRADLETSTYPKQWGRLDEESFFRSGLRGRFVEQGGLCQSPRHCLRSAHCLRLRAGRRMLLPSVALKAYRLQRTDYLQQSSRLCHCRRLTHRLGIAL